jgi:hypothetical protein
MIAEVTQTGSAALTPAFSCHILATNPAAHPATTAIRKSLPETLFSFVTELADEADWTYEILIEEDLYHEVISIPKEMLWFEDEGGRPWRLISEAFVAAYKHETKSKDPAVITFRPNSEHERPPAHGYNQPSLLLSHSAKQCSAARRYL